MVSLYLRALGRATVYTAVPMVFMLVVTVTALVWSMFGFWNQGNWLLLGIAGVILLLALWLVKEALTVSRRYQPAPEALQPAGGE
ncbi:hypothetical protein HRbin16_02415 [bacterium HR16]|nr:hypothetical protein HRbin16_02415 [bacterium HR16]